MNAEYTVGENLLGDSIWPEPALSALGEQRGEPVRVHVERLNIRPLYEHNPHITLTDEPGGHLLDCSAAWHHAIGTNSYFASGFFPQTGAEIRPETRLEFKLHGALIHPEDSIVLCPFSASCSSHSGGPPNKTMGTDWWEDLAGKLTDRLAKDGMDLAICSLGAKDEPRIADTICHRDQPLRIAAEMILACRMLITVETFGAVIAGGKTIGSTLVLNSATPISLHVSANMANRSVKVLREKYPWNWSQETIVDAMADMIKGDDHARR